MNAVPNITAITNTGVK